MRVFALVDQLPSPQEGPEDKWVCVPHRILVGNTVLSREGKRKVGQWLWREAGMGRRGWGQIFSSAFQKHDALQKPQAGTARLTEGVLGTLSAKARQGPRQTWKIPPSGEREGE